MPKLILVCGNFAKASESTHTKSSYRISIHTNGDGPYL